MELSKSICVFRRGDGSEWADYEAPLRATVLRRLEGSSLVEWQAIIASERGRVRALAERALREYLEQRPKPLLADIPRSVKERNFWQRLKWAFFRK